MVLDEASASSPSSDFYSDPTSFNPDSNGSTLDGSNADGRIQIDITSYPKPIPIFGSFFGYNPERQNHYIYASLQRATDVLQRNPTADEANALALYASQIHSYASYGDTTGTALGIYQSYRTRALFKFPFANVEKRKFDPNYFMGLLKGRAAQSAWHCIRGVLYAGMGWGIGGIIIGTVTNIYVVLQQQSDPRLAELARVRMEQLRSNRTQKPERQSGKYPAVPVARPRAREDDASPSAGTGEEYAYERMANEEARLYGNGGSAQIEGQPMQKQNMATVSRSQRRPPTNHSKPVSTPFYESDENSPSDPFASESSQPQSNGGSAWDRLRRGASSNTANLPRRGRQPGAQIDGSDSFSFSSRDEDKQLAKDEAQKEFDNRVEAERSGGDFGKGSRGGRW